ncbi:MAG: hypothetical protein SU899_00080 [Chloroflexota bacterium]|nr:hypothetical protein [Chloroflexota bacterium]
MDYQTATIWGIVKAVIWFGVIFGILPYLTFPKLKEESGFKTLLANLLLMIFLTVLVSHILVLLHIYDFFSLTVVFISIFLILAFRKARKSPRKGIREWLTNLNMFIFEASEGRAKIGGNLKQWLLNIRGRIARSLPRRTELVWWGGLLWVLVMSGYLRLAPAITNATVGPRESYLHLFWIKAWDMNQIYPSGIFPEGMHALVSALKQVTFLPEEILIRGGGGLVSVLLVFIIYVAVRELSKDRGAALISAAFYGIFAFAGFLPIDANRQIILSPLSTSLIVLLPTCLFLVDYLLHGKRRCLILYSVGVAASFFIHPLAGIVALIALIPALACHAIFRIALPIKDALKLLLGGIAAVAVGSLFPLIGLALDKPIYAGKPDLAREIFGGFLIDHDLPAIVSSGLPVMLIASCIAILLLILLQRFSSSKEEKFGAVSWGLIALILALLYSAGTFNIPEVFAPYSVGIILAPVLCVVVGLVYGRLWSMVSVPIKKIGHFGDYLVKRTQPIGESLGNSYLGIAVAVIIIGAMIVRTPEFTINMPLQEEYDVFAEEIYEIDQSYVPFTWTIVSSDEELPQVMGNGYFMNTNTFVDRYSPEDYTAHPSYPDLALPTPDVFIFMEKEVFIASDDDRESIEKHIVQQGNLAEWVERFEEKHQNLEIRYEDNKVKIVHVFRTPEEEEIFREWKGYF